MVGQIAVGNRLSLRIKWSVSPNFRPSDRSRRALLTFCALWTLAIPLSPVRVTAEPLREIELKAVYLFKFAHFMSWPDAVIPSDDSPIVFGILGDSEFFEVAKTTFSDKLVDAHPVKIRQFENVLEARDVQILFIGRSQRKNEGDVLAALGTLPIFSISDSEGMAERGATAHFYMAGNKIRFALNPRVAQASGLKISSKLLHIAKIVE